MYVHTYIYVYACLRLCTYTTYATLISKSTRFCEHGCLMHHASCICRCEPFGNDSGTIWKPFGRGEAKIRSLRIRRLQTNGQTSPIKNVGLFSVDVTWANKCI